MTDILDLFEQETQALPDRELELIGATLGIAPAALISAIREVALLETLDVEITTCASVSIVGEDLDIVRRDGTRLHVTAGGRFLIEAVITEAEEALLDAAVDS